MPEHFDMKSERQFERMALCCAAVTCAGAASVSAASAIRAAPGTSAWRNRVINKVMVVLPLVYFLVLAALQTGAALV